MLQAISVKSKECHASQTSATFLQQHPLSLPFFLSHPVSRFFFIALVVIYILLSSCSTYRFLISDIAFMNLALDISTHLALGIVGSPEVAVPPLCHRPAPGP